LGWKYKVAQLILPEPCSGHHPDFGLYAHQTPQMLIGRYSASYYTHSRHCKNIVLDTGLWKPELCPCRPAQFHSVVGLEDKKVL